MNQGGDGDVTAENTTTLLNLPSFSWSTLTEICIIIESVFYIQPPAQWLIVFS